MDEHFRNKLIEVLENAEIARDHWAQSREECAADAENLLFCP